jgi:hypothetical protein
MYASTGFRLDTDAWLKEYEKCKDLTQEIVQNIQVSPAVVLPACCLSPSCSISNAVYTSQDITGYINSH